MITTIARVGVGALALSLLLSLLAVAAGRQLSTVQLAFVAKERGGSEDIFMVDAERHVTTRLTYNTFPKMQPLWSPDGAFMAFTGRSSRSAGATGLYLMSADGRGLRRLVDGAADYLPAWSPDGAELAYVARQNGRFHVVVADVATGARRQLASQDNQIAFPTWSPDGSQLAYVVVFGRDDGLYVVSVDSGEERRLTDSITYTPAWSPDGREIAFTAAYTGNSEVYVIDVAGGGVRNVTRHEAYDSDPVWSPDGAWIAFYSLRECNELSLYVVDRDGANQRRLLDNCALSIRGTSDNRPPAWSPDGARIALTSQDVNALNIYAVHVGTGDIQRLTDFGAIVKYPAWRPFAAGD